MKFLLLLFPVLLLAKSPEKRSKVGIDEDNFLQLLEVEIARTLRSELSSDDDLQNLEGSSDSPEDDYLKKYDLILSSSTTSPKPITTTETTTRSTTTTTTTTTTTAAPSTTTSTVKITPKPLRSTPQCVPEKDCYKDSECPSGKCFGSELGLCDCNACITNKKCSSDLDCGGLRNGCDSNGNCDCVNAFHSHGYKLFVKVLLTFCHQTKCTKTSDNCYGLPCRVGKCKCFVGSGVGSKLPVHYFKPAGK
ncbi:Chondroitin proteoglycan 3 [Caenorhabditis elegans]|uniref:Chondroitin proteoglycan 3 n=1 Tax=Caenorhabditis elegans TaxID=6239 RepID=Q2PJ98_CAEEL|nr:Chondroitin proteoglycan 3 [Caenorhabditis elegans]CCD70807.1 Chondroitin proteoglycan 3 [Caenorhabditis elegans]|eukprot:NP_505164.4 Uncharacterized protein CELE_F52E1.5 [Caenorhabditis elegans]